MKLIDLARRERPRNVGLFAVAIVVLVGFAVLAFVAIRL